MIQIWQRTRAESNFLFLDFEVWLKYSYKNDEELCAGIKLQKDFKKRVGVWFVSRWNLAGRFQIKVADK